MKEYFRRTWLEINTDALRANYGAIRDITSPGAKIMAVVKADAYGHGVENVVKELALCGCDWFAVSNLEEAIQVRSVCSDCGVLILGYTPAEYAGVLALNNISQAVFDSVYADELSAQADKEGVTVSIHLKVDTGMCRLGFIYHDSERDSGTADEIARVCALPGLYPEGIFTHFARADEEGEGEVFTRLQFDLFLSLLNELEIDGLTFEYRHCCNSAATVLFPECHLDMVRPGVILYGLAPSETVKNHLALTPAMQMKTVVSMVKDIDEDSAVSYGGTFVSKKKMRVATVPIGYADGYPRSISGNTSMLINGHRVPVIGRICMDQCILDVTDVDGVKPDMSVTVFGRNKGNEITVDEIAKKHGTINYEIICGINKRVPRVYTGEGRIVAIADYMK